MRKLLLVLACITLVVAMPSCSKTSKYKAVIEQMSSQLPMDLGAMTMDKIEVDGDEFRYFYTFKQDPGTTAQNLEETTKNLLVESVKKQPEMKVFRDDKMTICFIYNKSDGSKFAEIKVTPDDYK